MLSQKTITGKMEVRGVHSPLTSYYITIHGGYPLSSNENKIFTITRTFEQAALKSLDKQIIIDCIEEPMMFASREHIEQNSNGLTWFKFLHSLSKKFNFPEENIVFLTSNVYGKESYNKWCTINNIIKKMQVHDQPKHLWLKRLILNGCSYIKKEETKHVSMFLGRPTLPRNIVMQWYLKNVVNTSRLEKMVTTFFYKNFSIPDEWNLTTEQNEYFSQLTKNSERNIDPPQQWLGETENFKNDFASCLFNFNVDYHEEEDFDSYSRYKDFKSVNNWWKEDVLSEKLFRSFIYKKPFIRLGMPDSLKVLRSWGFKTFDGILFDESYDDIADCSERANHILSQVTSYLDMPFDTLKEKIYSDNVQEVLNHNYNLAYKICNEAEELVNV
jgi:hypothetical protein